MHRRIGAAKYVVRINESTDDRPSSARGLQQLRAAFSAGRTDLADAPLGISISGRVEEQQMEVIRAVAGCSHLTLFNPKGYHVSPQLCAALALHGSLTHLSLTQRSSVLCDLMSIVVQTCKQLVSLEIAYGRSEVPNQGQTASMLNSIAALSRLQCLNLKCDAVNANPEDLAAVLQQPRLKYLQISNSLFNRAAMTSILGALATRTRPLRAFVLWWPEFTVMKAASELFSATGLQVLRRLYWLELYHFGKDTAVIDPFIDKALPMMTRLQRLAIYIPGTDKDALAQRIRAGIPRQGGVFTLTTGWNRRPARKVKLPSLLSLIAVLRAQPAGDPLMPVVRQELEQLESLAVSGYWSAEDVFSVCRDLLPHLLRLSEITFENGFMLTDALAVVLRDVLPRLPQLTQVVIDVDPQQRHLVRQVFSKFRPHSLLYVLLRMHDTTKYVVPIQMMRSALSASLVCPPPGRLLPPDKYFHHPDHADRPWPCAVPSLHDLCASFVLTQLPPDLDLDQIPKTLSRHSLREQLMPCDECGAYRRLPDAFISVRQSNSLCVEVLRCFPCYVRLPGEAFPYAVE